jgi:hypothetical protein
MKSRKKAKNKLKVMTEAEIRNMAEELVPKMNLRLIGEMSLSDNEPVLWVERIFVTDIEYPEPVPEEVNTKKSSAFWGRMFQSSPKPGFLARWLGHNKR